MAGETTLPAQYYPDDFQILTYPLNNTSALTVDTPWFYCDRNIIVDQVVINISTAGTGGSSPLVAICKTTAGTLAAPANVITSLTAISSTVSLAAAATTVMTTDSTTKFLDKTTNFVDAGNWVVFDLTGTMPSAALIGAITIRFRSRPK
jgi:hypothetical protein